MTEELKTLDIAYPDYDGTQLCAAEDPEMFFPGGRSTSSKGRPQAAQHHQIESAKRVCEGCPFARPCLAYALAWAVEGVWAATTRRERDAIREEHGIRARVITVSDVDRLHEAIAVLDQGGLTPAEIAERVGCGVQAVYEHRRRMKADTEHPATGHPTSSTEGSDQ